MPSSIIQLSNFEYVKSLKGKLIYFRRLNVQKVQFDDKLVEAGVVYDRVVLDSSTLPNIGGVQCTPLIEDCQ